MWTSYHVEDEHEWCKAEEVVCEDFMSLASVEVERCSMHSSWKSKGRDVQRHVSEAVARIWRAALVATSFAANLVRLR